MERIAVIMGKMHSGGKKNLVMEYYRHIDRSEIQFDFICDADSNAIPKDEIEALGGRFYIVAPYQNILKNMYQIYVICRENRYRIMHGYNGTMNIFAMFVGWVAGIPIRINESISMGHKSDKKTILKNMLKPFSRCFATHFIANGEECGKWQFGEELYKSGKVAIFKTVINAAENGFNKELRNKTRQEYGLQDNIVIGHIARLTAQKNTLFMIDIVNEVVRREPKARLLLIGDGELKEEMLERINHYHINDEVLYLGRREDIQQFYNAMDCFLLPSLYEGLPVVGVEAQTCGLPVFFSTEIPSESTVCQDLSFYIGLDKPASLWAETILDKLKTTMQNRRSRIENTKSTGFDSKTEACKLFAYYKSVI